MRKRLTGVLWVVSAIVTCAQCGGSGGGPNNPNPTPTSITINSTSGFLMLGLTETFTATIAFSNGTTQSLTGGTWGADAPAVATVGATTGLVTTVGRGDVTIFVDSQGIRGSKRITVVPDYRGTWSGTYVVNSCTQTGGFVTANFCASALAVGSTLPVALLNITQTGGTVSGSTALGQIISPQFSTVAVAGGGLMFSTNAQFSTTQIAQQWQLDQAVAGQLTGSVLQTWTDSTVSGQMVVGATLGTVTRLSSAALHSAMPDSRSGSMASLITALTRGY